MVGRQIDRYRIVEQIGSGGMAVVYKGFDTALDREVAVKVLHPHLASKEDSRRRFSREAKAVARLHHRNILEIYDFSGEDRAESFIVTEYIRGKTLRTFAETERLHPPEIAAMAAHELASALEHAHGIGVIHRDIKPENVMIRDDGVLKLTDFGIAKIMDRDERMTMTGALVGSPAHMAPEVIEGAEAGVEADIFSLGTILYWLCTEKLPFAGNNTTQTLKLILDGTYEDPRVSNAAVSDDLVRVIGRCLAREPSGRFPTATALREALAAVLTDAGIDRPGDELVRFFAAPADYRNALSGELVSRLVARATSFAREGRSPKALDSLNRVLALDPGHEAAHQLLARLKRRRNMGRVAAWSAGAVAALAATAGAATWFATRPPPPAPVTMPPIAAVPAVTEQPVQTSKPEVAPTPSSAPTIEPAALVFQAPAPTPVTVSAPPGRKVGAPGGAKPPKNPKAPALVASAIPTAPMSRLEVRVIGNWAEIDLDGVKIGDQHVEKEVPAGAHELTVKNRCCATHTEHLDLAAGQTTTLPEIRLSPLAAKLTINVAGIPSAPVVVMSGDSIVGSGLTGQPIRVDMLKSPTGEWAYRRTVEIEVPHHAEKTSRTVAAGDDVTVNLEPSTP